MELTIPEAAECLKSMWPSRAFMVPCLVGKPGIGKTQSVYQLRDWVRESTEFSDCKVVEMIASTILPSEVSGITMPDVEHRSLDIFDHVKLSSLNDGDILFFDELLQGSEQTLKACLTLIMERRMLSGKMLPDIMIIAACNNKDIRMVEPSIRQRFTWVDVRYYREAYNNFLVSKGVPNPSALLEIIDFNPTEWNILTPRTVFNLYKWFNNTRTEPVLKYIRNIYGATVAQNIKQSLVENKYQKSITSLKNSILEEGSIAHLISQKEYDDIMNCLTDEYADPKTRLVNAFVILQECKNWDKIQNELDEITIEEEE